MSWTSTESASESMVAVTVAVSVTSVTSSISESGGHFFESCVQVWRKLEQGSLEVWKDWVGGGDSRSKFRKFKDEVIQVMRRNKEDHQQKGMMIPSNSLIRSTSLTYLALIYRNQGITKAGGMKEKRETERFGLP